MLTHREPVNVKQFQSNDFDRAALKAAAIDAARCLLEMGAASTQDGSRRQDIIQMLNDSLGTELVCALRYKRHHFAARALASLPVAEEFLALANKAAAHADRLAQRIVQLGGQPDFSPDALTKHSRAAYDDSTDLEAMIRADLMAERVAIESYSQFVAMIGAEDSATRRLLEDIRAEEQGHVKELKDWLAD
jgi:bacterioferritin